MPKVELQLSEETLRLAQRSAEAGQASLDQWIAEAITSSAAPKSADPILGLFSDAPELMDRVAEDAMTTREQSFLRASHE